MQTLNKENNRYTHVAAIIKQLYANWGTLVIVTWLPGSCNS